MRTKHFLNDPEALVHSSLRSLPLLNPTVALDEENKIVYHRSLLGGKTVRIISGGGSGHEPSFGALVGKGGLAASVAGSVFASPNSRQVLSAIERVKLDGGVLVTVMNYTGDVLNFGVAVEKARTANPQLPIRMLVVGDDVSIPQEKAGKVGRRGIAGTVLVHKITGAAAALGRSLDDVFGIGSFVVRNLASIGASLDRVHVPGHSVGSSGNESLGQDEVELGMGIHNERGMARLKGQEASLPALVRAMLDSVFHSEHSKSTFSSSELGNVVLLVNNLGGVSVLELGAIVSEVREQLQATYNVKPVRTYAGTFMTSLDGPGFSISMLNLGRAKREGEILELLDAPIEALGWSSLSAGISWGVAYADTVLDTSAQTAAQNGKEENDSQIETVIPHLRAALNAIILAEPDVTRYDDIVGDGDCGTTLKRGAEAVLETISQTPLSLTQLVSSATKAVESSMDGTSGALYSIFFNALTQYIKLYYAAGRSAIDAHFWAEALHYATETLSKYTPAKIGDRTMMDALLPFVSTLRTKKDVNAAANAAEAGAELTKSMKASLGRAVYVGGETEWMGQIPDPGAWGVSQFLKGLAVSIATSSSPLA